MVFPFFDDQIKDENSDLEIEAERFGYLQNAVNGRYYWLNMLWELNKIQAEHASDRIWITSLEPVSLDGRGNLTDKLFQSGREQSKVPVPDLVLGRGEEAAPIVKYVRLRGLYHDNPPGTSAYPDLILDKIFELSKSGELPFFKFDENKFRRERASFINVNQGTENDRRAYDWEMLLPLDEENHKISYNKAVR